MKRSLLAFFFAIALVGCISHQGNWNFYYESSYNHNYDAGLRAEQKDDFRKAQSYFSNAIALAHRGYLGAEKTAWATAEWARVTGYLGDYEESKRAFLEAIQLLEESRGKNHPSIAPVLCELGQLHHDNGFHADATATYSRALPALEYVYVAEKNDPIGYALVLEAYAESLEEVGDEEQSAEIYQKAQDLRKNNVNKKALYKPKKYKK